MSTATATIQDPSLLTDLAKSGQAQVNDRTRQFVYTGGVPFMAMDPKKSGIRANPITGGRLHILLPKRQGYTGVYDPFKKVYPKLFFDEMPSDFVRVLKRAFMESQDMGLRDLAILTPLEHSFTGESYTDEAYAYFGVVHPTLSQCPFGLNKDIQLTEPAVGVSTPVFQFCPTCQLADLKSDACEERMRIASASGLNYQTLTGLKDKLIEACEASLAFVDRRNAEVLAEIDRRRSGEGVGRTSLNTIDHIHLKMMHRTMDKAPQPIIVQAPSITAEDVERMVTRKVSNLNVLSDEQMAEYKSYKEKQERMANARAAKGGKDDSSVTEANES